MASRPDIGIIHAGAGNKKLSKMGFSNYGSMVHLQAWGEKVITTGYGDLYYDGINDYTKIFNGTSAASPIVASAVVAVQPWYKQQTGDVLTPFQMRDLSIETGIPQKDPENGHIGPIPNVRNAINELHKRLLSKVQAVIEGPGVVYEKQKVILSAEKSKSDVADIVYHKWELPEGITADILDQSTLTFIAPAVIESQKFLINLTVTDALGNKNSTEHTFTLFRVPEFDLWDHDVIYPKGSVVSWKNKNWIAKVTGRGLEPGRRDFWEEYNPE